MKKQANLHTQTLNCPHQYQDNWTLLANLSIAHCHLCLDQGVAHEVMDNAKHSVPELEPKLYAWYAYQIHDAVVPCG
jgi:hypothetical protein